VKVEVIARQMPTFFFFTFLPQQSVISVELCLVECGMRVVMAFRGPNFPSQHRNQAAAVRDHWVFMLGVAAVFVMH
jgi:hypothetical protein